MVRIVKLISASVVIATSLMFSADLAGQPPPPPIHHGANGNQSPGGQAPLPDGALLLVTMAAAYGMSGILRNKKKGCPNGRNPQDNP